MKNLLIYFILTLGLSAQAQQNLRTSDAQQHTSASVLRNYVKNSGAEKNPLISLTDTNSIASRTTSNVISGAASFLLDATTSGHFVGWQLDALQDDMEGNAVAEFDFKGDGSLYKAYVYNTSDSTVVSAEQQLSNASTTAKNYILFVANPAKAYELRIAATDNAAAAFRVDNVTVRKATAQDVATIAQPSFFGAVRVGGGNNFTNGSVTGYMNFGYVSGASPTYTFKQGSGTLSAPSSNRAGFSSFMPAGSYNISYVGPIRYGAGTSNFCQFRFTDGTTNSDAVYVGQTGNGFAGNASFTTVMTFNTAATREIALQVAQTGVGECAIPPAASVQAGSIEVTYIPPSSTVIRTQAPGADWTAYTPTGSWSANTTYSGFYQCSGATLSLRLRAQTSGAPTATPLYFELPLGFSIDSARMPTTNDTVSVGSGVAVDPGSNTYLVTSAKFASSNTRIYALNPVTISGANPQALGHNSVSNTSPFTFGNTDYVELTATVPVTADSPCPAPTAQWVKQGVIGAYEGTLKIIGVRVGSPGSPCAASPCTMADAYGVSSVTRATTGDYTINFSTPFVGNPICDATAAYHPVLSDRTSSSIRLRTNYPTDFTGGQANTDSFFEVTCFGRVN